MAIKKDHKGSYAPSTPGLQKKINKTVKRAKSGQTQPAVRLREYDDNGREIPEGANDERGNNFPGNYIPADPRDTDMAMRRRMLEKDPFTGEKVNLYDTITEEDKKYMKDKQAQLEYLNKLEYRRSMIDQTDPTAMAIQRMKGLTKEQDEAERAVIKEGAENALRAALIRQGGTAGLTAEDIDFIQAVDAGYKHIPSGALWDPNSYKYAGDTWTDNRKRGFFNPKKMFPNIVATFLRKQNDPFPNISRNQTLARSVRGLGNTGGSLVKNDPDLGRMVDHDWSVGIPGFLQHT